MEKSKLEQAMENFAKVILEVGLDLQKGDGLMITMDEHSLPLVRLLAKEAFKAGAKDILYQFADDELNLNFFEHASDEALADFAQFKVDYREQAFLNNYHSLYLASPNPELLKDIDNERITLRQRTTATAMKPIQHYQMDNKVKWCVVTVPGPAWASKVFPELPVEEAIAKLWDLVLEATRMNDDDPVASWKAHDKKLKEKEAFMDGEDFEKLIYRAPGTDLEVYLVEGHKWIGGSSRLPRGDVFMANIPTEELFTMPHRAKVNGTLKATKPLSLQGKLVDGFTFVFEEGKVVSYEAEQGKELLEQLFSMDEGAMRLGEVAIVPDDSPISNIGVLFYNTLFDENASCHFAFGNAYGENMPGTGELSEEEKKERGMNHSMIHVDFMVGGPELEIIGVKKDGTEVPLLKNGNWVE